MERRLLPGEKRIYQECTRVEEAEREEIQRRADREGVPRSFVVRQAIRHYLDLEDPVDEFLPPTRRLRE